MDRLRNQAFPSQRSLNFFNKKFLVKILSKIDYVKTVCVGTYDQ